MPPSSKPRTIKCPHCGNNTVWSPENKYRPFCSERCKLIDLGQWAAESYRIPAGEEGKPKPESDN